MVFLATRVATASRSCGWQLAPGGVLVGLLLISAAHFSATWSASLPREGRAARPRSLPALLHAQELGDLFAALAPAATGAGGAR